MSAVQTLATVTGSTWATVAVGVAGLIATVAVATAQAALANRRHAAQLAHDRAVSDRARLLDLLDTAASTFRRAMWSTDVMLERFRAGA